MTDLPQPACTYGYTFAQLEAILGDRMDEFSDWMSGQTMTLCQGEKYDYDTGEMVPACGGVAHGAVVYRWDLQNYLMRGPVADVD